tara:strand:+ start:641 stop:2323 length:1683 start_codon:yes stop_codon:yes gene_type:complete
MNEVAQPTKALIYCRVSTKKQLQGAGLSSQEHRCRQYCEAKNYSVEAVFPDDASGGGDFMKRPGMVALLQYLDAHARERFVVVFDDLRRYSRDIEFHFRLRREMEDRHATRECLNFNFDDTPEGLIHEGFVTLTGHYERLVNYRQSRQKSIARLEQGFCVQSIPPIGYRYEKASMGGKMLVRNEPDASVVQELLEGYASGRFASQAEVTRFINNHPTFPTRNATKKMTQYTVVKMLRQPLYAGLVGSAKFGVPTRPGHHDGLVSIETFQRIQDRLDGRSYAAPRIDIAEDFPLRSAVCCAECDTPLTGGWSKGKYKKYPYMFCRQKGCSQYGKTIPRGKIEGEFEELLAAMQPTQGLVDVATAMFRDVWDRQAEQSAAMSAALKRDIKKIEEKITQTIDAVVEATNPRVVSAYEKRIEGLEMDKLALLEKSQNLGKPRAPFGELLELSLRFLSNPCTIWKKGGYELRQIVLRLVFPGHLQYSRKEGFRTPKISLPFKALGAFSGVKNEMVPRGRIELPTSPLPRVRSTTELPRRCIRRAGSLPQTNAIENPLIMLSVKNV